MKLLKSLNHHLLMNVAITVIVMATGHLVFFVLGQL
jgi:hypothetical protein